MLLVFKGQTEGLGKQGIVGDHVLERYFQEIFKAYSFFCRKFPEPFGGILTEPSVFFFFYYYYMKVASSTAVSHDLTTLNNALMAFIS